MIVRKRNWVLTAVLLSWSTASMSGVESTTGKISRLLSDSEYYGHCMIALPYTATNNDCPNVWVSLDCVGRFNGKESSRRLWDAAQLAYAMDSNVFVVINDQKKYNGFCVADRLDVIK